MEEFIRGRYKLDLKVGQKALPLHPPDVILVGKDNDHSGIRIFTQSANDLVKFSGSWFPWYFH